VYTTKNKSVDQRTFLLRHVLPANQKCRHNLQLILLYETEIKQILPLDRDAIRQDVTKCKSETTTIHYIKH